jgi:5-methylcytosine-specific restriction endonuclease McrA
MLKGCIVLEQTDTYIRVKHISTGDISLRHKAACPLCGKDRGWKKRFKVDKPCKGCAQHSSFLSQLDKTQFKNVDFTNSITHKKPNKGSEVRYKTMCHLCSNDRGYLPLSSSHKLCRCCSRKKVHSNTSLDKKQLKAQKISMTQTGHGVFSGFTTSKNEKQRSIFKSRNLSKQTFDQDDYTCQHCKAKGTHLHAHHLNGFDLFPEQRFELTNLVTLCKSCHNEFHSKFGKGKNTEEQFLQFQSATIKKELTILTGAPASGKSWVVRQLSTYDVIDSDVVGKKDLVSKCEAVSKPLLALTVGVSTFIKNNPQFSIKLIVIQETQQTVEQRMLERGGKITPTIERRIKRMLSLSKQAVFTGTSQEVLEYLK